MTNQSSDLSPLTSGNSSFQAALPFSTTDAILANCLRDIGFVECSWSPKNVYDADILFRAGGGAKDPTGKILIRSRYAGMTLIEAARLAWKERTKGRVEYHFEHTPEINYFREAYRDQCEKIDQAEGDPSAAILEIMRLAAGRLNEGEKIMDEREAAFRVLVIGRKLRVEYVNRWKKVVPTLCIREPGPVKETSIEDGGTRRSFPGVKEVAVNASEKTLRELKLI